MESIACILPVLAGHLSITVVPRVTAIDRYVSLYKEMPSIVLLM